MQIKINESDLSRILGKLKRMDAMAPTFKFTWRINLLNEYKQKVSGLMGSVSGRGGYPNITITGEPSGESEYWYSLAPMTVLRKAGTINEAATTIWYDTGKTKNSFTIVDNWVGVVSSYAKRVEEGDEDANLPARPLFGLANHLVEQAIRKACHDPESKLGRSMRRGVIDLARACGWGD